MNVANDPAAVDRAIRTIQFYFLKGDHQRPIRGGTVQFDRGLKRNLFRQEFAFESLHINRVIRIKDANLGNRTFCAEITLGR